MVALMGTERERSLWNKSSDRRKRCMKMMPARREAPKRLVREKGPAGSKTLHRQNFPVLNWTCRLTQLDLRNGGKWLLLLLLLLLLLTTSNLSKWIPVRWIIRLNGYH